jgi:sugar O-acyltransferase (sialic acid O-acetyltransferase NeuD family)
MTTKQLVIIGAGGHAKSCIEIIETLDDFEIACVVGLESEVGQTVLGHKISDTDADLESLRDIFKFAFIAVGQLYDPGPRINLEKKLIQLGFKLPAFVSKNSLVSRTAKIGEGSIVMNGAIINSQAVIGRLVTVNSGALIEHDVSIGDHSHIATRAIVNGGVRVGKGTFIGSGAVIRNGIEIGENSFIGMGSLVTTSLSANSIIKATN